MAKSAAVADPEQPKLIHCEVSAGFTQWLAEARVAVAVSTYQAGKVALVGWNGSQASIVMRHFERPMGLAIDGHSMALATAHQLFHFENAHLLAGAYLEPDRYDALFLPRVCYFTGPINAHDLAFDRDGLLVVNTRFSCLCRMSPRHSFEPVWQPPFISRLAPEDRCHLNGLALVDGQARYVTMMGMTDTPRGWSDRRVSDGLVMDVGSGEVVSHGWAMPHSPRWHDGRLWALNSGQGELCIVEPGGRRTVVCALQGYTRGLCFVGDKALVGLSKIREKHVFAGMPVQQRYDRLLCGVALVDLPSGRCQGLIEFTAGAEELYDVQVFREGLRPNILNLARPIVHQSVTAPDFAYWLADPSRDAQDSSAANSKLATSGGGES